MVETAFRVCRYINEGPFIFKNCDYHKNPPILYFEGFNVSIKSSNTIIIEKTNGDFDEELLISGLEKMFDNIIIK